MKLIESILADAASIAAVRRDIHAHPELCFEEVRTSDVIAKQLTAWGIPIHRGMGRTGVVARPEAASPASCSVCCGCAGLSSEHAARADTRTKAQKMCLYMNVSLSTLLGL